MTPKEKAENLIWKYLTSRDVDGHNDVRDVHAAIRCALIAVDEIIKAVNNPDETYLMKDDVNYWQEVKQEIEKL